MNLLISSTYPARDRTPASNLCLYAPGADYIHREYAGILDTHVQVVVLMALLKACMRIFNDVVCQASGVLPLASCSEMTPTGTLGPYMRTNAAFEVKSHLATFHQ